jgi:hypothetical protein
MRSGPLSDALLTSSTQPYLVGMGQPEHALEFRRKLRIDQQTWPLHVVGGVDLEGGVGSGPAPVYGELGFMHKGSLGKVFTETVNLTSLTSSLRAVATGHFPSYSSGGDLSQFGGTLVLPSLPPAPFAGGGRNTAAAEDPQTDEAETVVPRLLHVEEMTGGHMPANELANQLLTL